MTYCIPPRDANQAVRSSAVVKSNIHHPEIRSILELDDWALLNSSMKVNRSIIPSRQVKSDLAPIDRRSPPQSAGKH
ncbi:MAG: hypothetical protein LH613_17825 [Chamaesiphon sp.]|nr:hypothetical protein [Chamaesiphon sp.]